MNKLKILLFTMLLTANTFAIDPIVNREANTSSRAKINQSFVNLAQAEADIATLETVNTYYPISAAGLRMSYEFEEAGVIDAASIHNNSIVSAGDAIPRGVALCYFDAVRNTGVYTTDSANSDWIEGFDIGQETSDLTISLWANVDTAVGNGMLVSFQGVALNESICINHGFGNMPNVVAFVCSDSSGDMVKYTAGNVCPPGEWHHYVLVIDRTASTLYGYIDGELVGTESNADLSSSLGNDGIMAIGRWAGGDLGYISASFDNVRVFTRAVDATEVKNVYELEVLNKSGVMVGGGGTTGGGGGNYTDADAVAALSGPLAGKVGTAHLTDPSAHSAEFADKLDTLTFTTHAANADAHHVKYTDAEAVTANAGAINVVQGNLTTHETDVNAHSAEFADKLDTLTFTTHEGNPNVHHVKYTAGEAVTDTTAARDTATAGLVNDGTDITVLNFASGWFIKSVVGGIEITDTP